MLKHPNLRFKYRYIFWIILFVLSNVVKNKNRWIFLSEFYQGLFQHIQSSQWDFVCFFRILNIKIIHNWLNANYVLYYRENSWAEIIFNHFCNVLTLGIVKYLRVLKCHHEWFSCIATSCQKFCSSVFLSFSGITRNLIEQKNKLGWHILSIALILSPLRTVVKILESYELQLDQKGTRVTSSHLKMNSVAVIILWFFICISLRLPAKPLNWCPSSFLIK